MSDKPITIAIRGKVSYEDTISVAQAAQIITFLNVPEEDDPVLGSVREVTRNERNTATANSRKSGNAVGSAREALDLSGARTNPEKIVALGEYVLQDGGETFKVEDIKTQFRRARETAPANFSRDLSTAVQAGWIAQGDGDEYYITNKIQGIFDGDFEFPTRLEGFPAYSKMKSNKDKLLWGLQFAKVNDINGLANKDIAWLTDHLGAGVPVGQITAAFNSAKSGGYANRSTQDNTIRITEEGTAYLTNVGIQSQ